MNFSGEYHPHTFFFLPSISAGKNACECAACRDAEHIDDTAEDFIWVVTLSLFTWSAYFSWSASAS